MNPVYDQIRPTLKIHKSVYKPLEDSRILGLAVEKYAFGKFLDMGTGTGMQGIIAAKKGCDVVFSDVNPKAVECAKENAALHKVKGKFVVSDLFSKINGKFNTIAFDTPHLISKPFKIGRQNPSFDGGHKGRDAIEPFLKNYKRHVLKDHVVLMVESYWNNYDQDIENLNAEIVAKRHYPFLGDFVVLKFE